MKFILIGVTMMLYIILILIGYKCFCCQLIAHFDWLKIKYVFSVLFLFACTLNLWKNPHLIVFSSDWFDRNYTLSWFCFLLFFFFFSFVFSFLCSWMVSNVVIFCHFLALNTKFCTFLSLSSLSLPFSLLISLSLPVSFFTSLCMCVCLLLSLSGWVSLCLSLLSFSLSPSVFGCLSLFICLSVCLFQFNFLYLYLHIFLSLSPTLSLPFLTFPHLISIFPSIPSLRLLLSIYSSSLYLSECLFLSPSFFLLASPTY